MLRFITKKEYWKIIQDGIEEQLHPSGKPWHLKDIQDAVAAHYLLPTRGLKIAEIGGGKSRVLQSLSERNDVYNIDKFDGSNNGPKKKF
ncbi:hypothetical protein [Parvularcula sp. IMCC14364]|uniref:hypothetical protein n=1 Tax=Parvularcula sp. IMCC14364 TaxID=3067902 RepID=UPI0027411E21|nr:hypothetical protein [Parvularcula sp. IMCC14364]